MGQEGKGVMCLRFSTTSLCMLRDAGRASLLSSPPSPHLNSSFALAATLQNNREGGEGMTRTMIQGGKVIIFFLRQHKDVTHILDSYALIIGKHRQNALRGTVPRNSFHYRFISLVFPPPTAFTFPTRYSYSFI